MVVVDLVVEEVVDLAEEEVVVVADLAEEAVEEEEVHILVFFLGNSYLFLIVC